MNIKTIIRSLAALSLTAVLAVPASHAASGTTTVNVTFPPLIILYYFNQIDVALSSADVQALLANNGNTFTGCVSAADGLECAAATNASLAAGSGTVDAVNPEITFDANITGDANVPAGGLTTTISVILQNSWAVRALSSTALSATVPAGAIGDFSSVTISPGSPDVSLTLGGANNNIGDLTLNLDIDNTTTALLATGDITITVVAL